MEFTPFIEQWFESSPFGGRMGFELAGLAPDRAEVRLPFAAANSTQGEVLHGGAIAALIDVAGTTAAFAGDAPSAAGATIGMTVDYIRAARGQDLLAVGRVLRRAGGLCFSEVDVRDPDDRLVAKGLVTYRYAV